MKTGAVQPPDMETIRSEIEECVPDGGNINSPNNLSTFQKTIEESIHPKATGREHHITQSIQKVVQP